MSDVKTTRIDGVEFKEASKQMKEGINVGNEGKQRKKGEGEMDGEQMRAFVRGWGWGWVGGLTVVFRLCFMGCCATVNIAETSRPNDLLPLSFSPQRHRAPCLRRAEGDSGPTRQTSSRFQNISQIYGNGRRDVFLLLYCSSSQEYSGVRPPAVPRHTHWTNSGGKAIRLC